MRAKSRHRLVLLGLVLGLSVPGARTPASVIIELGDGWEAELFSTPANVLDLTVDPDGDPDRLVLEKFATFSDIDLFTGRPASLSIVFRQVLPDEFTASQIVITEEFITNNSGVNWTGFRMILLGDHVSFKMEGLEGFTAEPFTEFDLLDGSKEVIFDGGTLSDGSTWNPRGVDGGLVINVNLAGNSSDDLTFVLKELPVIPAPGTLALLAGFALRPRRRR